MKDQHNSTRQKSTRRRFGHASRMAWASLIGIVACLPAQAIGSANSINLVELVGVPYVTDNYLNEKVIRVGVRADAEPFSYLKPSRADNRILPRYSGYIVEICRTVLRQIAAGEIFHRYSIEAVSVTAGNRFEMLANAKVDLLCGPDSITTERLRHYNVSYPVFLSGIARVKVPTENMPRSTHCQAILGLVEGTTSEQAGIQAMTKAGFFGRRFEPAIKKYLRQKANIEQIEYKETLNAKWKKYTKALGIDGDDSEFAITHSGKNDVIPALVITDECPSGFINGPVVTYKSHATGLKDLCSGNILYYLGDIDIVKRNLAPGCDHIEFSQQTFTKEAYGIYFRKPPRTPYKELNEEERRDAVLYSEFNNHLVLQMQSAERLLENQYREEFGDAEMAVDLQNFFSSLQFATDY